MVVQSSTGKKRTKSRTPRARADGATVRATTERRVDHRALTADLSARAARPRAQRFGVLALWVRAAGVGVIFYVLTAVIANRVCDRHHYWFGFSTADWMRMGGAFAAILIAAWGASRLWLYPARRSILGRLNETVSTAKTPQERRSGARAGGLLSPSDPVQLITELSLLYEIAHGVGRTIELEELLDTITSLVADRLVLREFAILLLDPQSRVLRVRAAVGFPDPARVYGMHFALGEGICGEAAAHGRLVYLRDTRRDPRFLYYRGELKSDGSFLSIPLLYQKEILGVVNLGREGVGSFQSQEIRVLQLIANQIAMAIANAKLYAKTRELAVRDELTGLYNRRHFHEVLQIEWKRAVRFRRPLAVLMIDVDHFKHINDKLGHLQGDQVLKRVADVLKNNLREVDTLARFGGEEFIVLLPDTDRSGALHVAEKVRRFVAQESRLVEGSELTGMTVSIGVSVFPDDAQAIDDLIDHADIALYEAKDSGRNRVVAYPILQLGSAAQSGPRLVT